MFEKDEFFTRVEEEYTKMLESGKHRLSRLKYLILIPLVLLIIAVIS